jgi:DNA-binding NtrC family response regulator
VIFISGTSSVELAVEALRSGATDFLTKPVDFARVKMALANLTQARELARQVGALRGELRRLGRFGSLIGASTSMQRVYDLIAKVAPTEASVLVLGETGTGKELVAQTLHDMSARRKAPFVPINCGAVSPTLIESELFGHERGSFTGAERSHRGHFERAHQGTLFLDEISEMPVDLQVKLLRVLETGRVLRVGGADPIEVDVRILAASNRPPQQAVADGKLREDLHYRLNVFPIQLPPLRERDDDVALLAEAFLEQLNQAAEGEPKSFTRAALDRLKAHPWPGNVRELRNVVQRAFILAPNDIGVDALPLGVVEERLGTTLAIRVGTPIDEAERRLILATLEHCAGDKKKAAEILKISLKTLYNRLNVYNA